MSIALAMGRRGLGRTWPNPSVGCVIVSDGQIVGKGCTGDGGRPHAEVVALKQAGLSAKGATAYLTLEPCSHFGQTPPCAQALIEAGIYRVVGAMNDKDPRVNGQGFEMLRNAGLEVLTGVAREEAEEDHRGFFKRIMKNSPYITLKLAASLDGRLATASGQSQWITASPARRFVHALRARHDAVMVGGGTVRKDNPMLSVRGLGIDHKTVRVVVSRKLDLPKESALAESIEEFPVWLCHGPDAPDERIKFWDAMGAKLIPCRLKMQMIDVAHMMQGLADQGLTRVFCEGGGALAASLIDAQCVDELIEFNAGLMIGAEGQPSIATLGIKNLFEAPRFMLKTIQKIGPDIMHVWKIQA